MVSSRICGILFTMVIASGIGVVVTLAIKQQTDVSHSASSPRTEVHKGTPIFKVVIAGEGGVGKSSILQYYISQHNGEPVMTVGSEFAYQEIKVNGSRIGLSIWDFGGEERFRELMPIFCLGAHGALIVFDLNRYSTFLQLDFWMEVIQENTENIPIILVGAKSDLEGGPSDEDIRAFCQHYKVKAYIPVSAWKGINIDILFTHIAKLMQNATKEGIMTPAYSVKC